ncbi:MAG: hypothetical protein J6Q39_12460 [Bacteroidales bacterium]|nr:hypothetical protein [Bacteroidales bacterium]
MKKITLLLGVALMTLVMASCGSQKQVASNLPCPECQPTTEVFRYLGQHVATGDRQIQQARSMAANAARAELATQVTATVKRVVDNYTSEYISGADSDFNQRVQDLARTVVNQLLVGTRIVCEGTMPGSTAGNTICFACVELTGKSVLDGIANKIGNDEKLRTDFEYEKFKKVLEEEMSKMEK